MPEEAEQIAKFIANAKKLKILAKGGKAVRFIERIIENFVNKNHRKGAQDALNDILSDDPVPEPVAKLGRLTYLNSLAEKELAEKESSKNVAESKRASHLSLVGALYSN